MDGTADLELVDKNITDDKGNYAEASNTNSSSLDYRLNTAWKTGIAWGTPSAAILPWVLLTSMHGTITWIIV